MDGRNDERSRPGPSQRSGDLLRRDREHREQLKAWARAQADEGAFREVCRLRGWNRTTALRHVGLALAHLFMVMIRLDRRDL